MNLTREQVEALRHLTIAIRYAVDEVGSPFYEGHMVKTVTIVEKLMRDAEVDNVRREIPRSLELAK